jgi:hypothetical protein
VFMGQMAAEKGRGGRVQELGVGVGRWGGTTLK